RSGPGARIVASLALRILICDDHPLFRQGLRRLLETVRDFEVVAEVERGDEVLPAIRKKRPDVVVLDVELPGGSGIGALEQVRSELPEARVLMLSGFSDPTRVRAALRGGADGYVLKNAPPAELLEAIRRVGAGRSVLAPAVAEAVATSLRAEPEEERARRLLSALSDREREVLRLAAAGESNAGIGKRLFISEGTVKNHMTHILRKLEVEDRTQAAILAVKHGVAG
ncbi:MAG: response regulator transcription factor, partial [Chloroflexi bacterium]|nr:response regulator transcription factor [Chloroflexota bacterium]